MVDTRFYNKVAAYLTLDDPGSPCVSAATPLPVYGVSTGTVLDVTLTLDTLVYASGDVLSDTATLTNAVRANGGRATLRSIVVIDEDDQGIAFDIVFFSATQSLGTKNVAPAITDAAARDALGHISIVAGDYIDLGGVRIATLKNIQLKLQAATASRDLFLGTITRGAPTYTASGLRLRLALDWD